LDKIKIICVYFNNLNENVSKLGLLHSNLGEVKNVSVNWKNLVKFQQTKPTLTKQQ